MTTTTNTQNTWENYLAKKYAVDELLNELWKHIDDLYGLLETDDSLGSIRGRIEKAREVFFLIQLSAHTLRENQGAMTELEKTLDLILPTLLSIDGTFTPYPYLAGEPALKYFLDDSECNQHIFLDCIKEFGQNRPNITGRQAHNNSKVKLDKEFRSRDSSSCKNLQALKKIKKSLEPCPT